MRFENEGQPLLELGCIPKVTIPTWARIIQPHYPIRLDQSYSKVNQRFPASEGSQSLSEDQNAIKLGRVIKPEIVIGIKALQCIFASQLSGDTDWIIPFTVVKFDEKLVFFIDEPLMQCSAFTILEKNRLFAEAATKEFLLKSDWNYVPQEGFHQTTTKTEDGNGNETQETEKKIVVTSPPARESLSAQDELFTNDDVEMEDLETFGQGARVDGGNDTDSEEERGLLIATESDDEEEEPVVPKRGRPKRSKQIEPISPPPTLKKTRTTRSSPTPYENPIENMSQSSTSSHEFSSPKQRNSKRVKSQRGPVTKINPDTLELVEEEVASCDEILAQEVSNIKEKPSVKEMPSLNLSVNSTPDRISQSNENIQIKTPPEQVEITPNPFLYPMAIQQR